MGNLIKDFWTYTYKDRSYYGVVEVVLGDLQYRRKDGKYETRIEKALNFLIQSDKKILSHMSVQSYNEYLNKHNRQYRQADEEAYYPFFIEFETHKELDQTNFLKEYQAAAEEAYRTIQYLINEMHIDPEDLLIIINNSRSIYLFINPVSYGLKPSKVQHLIYKKIFEQLNEVIDFKYADIAHYRFNGLIKTPGSYYKNGYVVPISIQQLKNLVKEPALKSKLTRKKKSIDKDIPGKYSRNFNRLYVNAKEEVYESYKEQKRKKNNKSKKIQYIDQQLSCITYLENTVLDKGSRHFALVGIAIAYKNAGYSIDQVNDIVQETADKWNHDESTKQLERMVKKVFKEDYNFSCQYIRERVDLCNACASCRFNKQSLTKFKVNRDVISQLNSNKASLRHYKAYLVMSRNQLFNTYFCPQDYNIDQRTIRELAKYIETNREINNGLVRVELSRTKHNYLLPNEFIDDGVYELLKEGLKSYLTLYTHFTYKAYDKYGIMRVSIEKIKSLLGHKHITSSYKFIKKLVQNGIAVMKKGYLVALYFASYKVISIEEHKTSSENKKSKYGANNESKSNYVNKVSGEKLYWQFSRGSP